MIEKDLEWRFFISFFMFVNKMLQELQHLIHKHEKVNKNLNSKSLSIIFNNIYIYIITKFICLPKCVTLKQTELCEINDL